MAKDSEYNSSMELNIQEMSSASKIPTRPQSGGAGQANSQASDSVVEHSDIQGVEANHLSGLKLYILLASLYLCIFCLAMDKTMLSPALGTITTEFGTVKDVGWYSSSYLLTSSCVQSLYGAIYKTFDTKWTFIGALVVFETGSLISALAPISDILILGRAISGLGNAGLAAGTYVILAQVLPLHKRAAFFGLLGSVWGVASILGPLVGGAFAEHLTWRWCFWINLPIGGVAILTVGFIFTGSMKRSASDLEKMSFFSRVLQLDLAGAATLAPAVIMLLLAIQWGGTEFAWKSPTIIGLFTGFGVLLLIFGGIQQRAQDNGLLPPRFFQQRDVCCALLFSFFFGACYFAIFLYLSIFFQAIQSASAVQAGLRLLPLSISAVFSSTLSGVLIGILRNYNAIILGETALMCIGVGLITTFSLDTPMSHWFSFEIILGLGVGVGFQAGQIVVQNSLSYDMLPQAMSNVQFFMSLGGAVSVAAAQAVFQNGVLKVMALDTPQVSPSVVLDTGASALTQKLGDLGLLPETITAIRNAYMTGLRNAYYICTAMAACAILAGLGMRWKRLSEPPRKMKA